MLNEIAQDFLTACAGIVCIATAFNWIMQGINVVGKPTKRQNERLSILEKQSAEYEKKLNHDWERIEAIEVGNRVSQRALLALLEHGIDGNDIDAMKKAKIELQEFLINGR